jgi:hypothetical protein
MQAGVFLDPSAHETVDKCRGVDRQHWLTDGAARVAAWVAARRRWESAVAAACTISCSLVGGRRGRRSVDA